MDRVFFISDIHLSESEPGISALFFDFLGTLESRATALYILGDLFDAWVGDDDLDDPFNRKVVSRLKHLADAGTSLNIMHGNRDFLMGRRFFEAAGAIHLSDPCIVDLCGDKVLLSHGDALCVADREYQAFREQVRDASWQADFLSQPLFMRKETVSRLRRESEERKREKPCEIMDVDPREVDVLLKKYACTRMIHGHTHRPGRHVLHLDSLPCQRWVLGDWHDDGAACICCEDGNLFFLDASPQ